MNDTTNPDFSTLPMEETPTVRFDNAGHFADSPIEGEPLRLTDEQRAALPPLEAAPPDAPNVFGTSSVSDHPDAAEAE